MGEVVDLGLRQAHADDASRPHCGPHRAGDFRDQAQPAVDAAAVAVVPQIDAFRQKLVQQITVRAMDLDAIEPRFARTGGCLREAGHGGVDVLLRHRGGHGVIARPAIERHLLALWPHGRRADGAAAVRVALRQRAGMHQLRDHAAAPRLHALDDGPPRIALRRVRQPRLMAVPLRERRVREHAFRDDEAEAPLRELRVILGHARGRQAIGRGAHARHRRDCQAVGQGQRPEDERLEETGDVSVITHRRLPAGVRPRSPRSR